MTNEQLVFRLLGLAVAIIAGVAARKNVSVGVGLAFISGVLMGRSW